MTRSLPLCELLPVQLYLLIVDLLTLLMQYRALQLYEQYQLFLMTSDCFF
jgi:hypothetical protein